MVHSARATGYIVSGLPTYSRATTGRRPLTPRTTTQVRLFKQLLDKRTGALLALPLDWLVVGVCDNLKVSTTDVIPQIGAGNARFGGG